MKLPPRPWFRPSAGARVALAVILAVVVSTLLLSGVSYIAFSRQLSDTLDDTLFREAEAYAAAIETAAPQSSDEMVEASQQYLAARRWRQANVALALRLPDRPVVSSAPESLLAEIEEHYSVPFEQATRALSEVGASGETYRVVTMPLRDDTGQTLAVFLAASSTDAFRPSLSNLLQALAQAGLLVVIAGTVASGWAAQRTLRPLHRAALTAGEITDRSLSRRVPYDGPRDDVGILVESLNRMLDRLETSFAEQRRFASDASHEMRTPLTIVLGHLEVMRSDQALTEEQAETLDLAVEELQRMSNVIGDLLSLARLEGGALPPFATTDLSEIVEDALVGAQTLGDRRFSFLHGGALPVRGNRDLLLQAVLNLLSNAVRHTAPGGLIGICCEAEGSEAHVTVADDGAGIAPQDLERIFDRFYRSPGSQRGSAGGGSGLGLAIARRLVELHGGRLTAANAEDGGAVFHLRLPLVSG